MKFICYLCGFKYNFMTFRQFTIALAVCVLTLAACDNNNKYPDEPTPVEDDFAGDQSVLQCSDETASLSSTDIELLILTPDGTEITRPARHKRSGGRSTIQMSTGLREGEYRLLAARYENPDASLRDEFPTVEYGLGSRIAVSPTGISIIDPFDARLGYAGMGTKESPYVVSSSSHLVSLMMAVNDYDSWQEIPAGTYFKQVRNIDMKQSSRSCDIEYGWLPIGADTNTPFRGVYLGEGHCITNLIINRPDSPGIGLFGYILDATIDGLTLRNCTVAGQFAVGCLAGASITSSASRGISVIINCEAENCSVSGNETSAALGTLLGAADMYTKTLIANCSVADGSVGGGMNVGGIMGASGIFSSTSIENCTNGAGVSAHYSGAGGIIGTTDTLQVVACRNTGDVSGGSGALDGKNPGIGTGGIAGGAGMSWITSSVNSGRTSGHEGVGGIIGSTRVRGSSTEGYLYNQSVLRHCSNSGAVSGTRFVGGAIGEAQAGCYGVCNTGAVTANEYAGGICGNSSVAVIHNSVNSGSVEGERYVAGIVAKTTWGSFALDQNYGNATGRSGITAGVVGLAGNNTVVHYCANYGAVTGPGNQPVGGIVGEIGDPREWTAMNIAECVIGSLECVMAVAGPVLAITEHVAELAYGIEVTLKIMEFGTESCLQIADYTLLGFGVDELVNPEAEAELSADIKAEANTACTEISEQIRSIRATANGSVANFDATRFNDGYSNNIAATQNWYETEGNDEKFNESINEAREARAEANEKVAKAHETAHTVVAGVAVLTSTVALIGTTVASGGTATAFMALGSVAAVVGGVNAIVKSCTEFENNAVVISQCVNAGDIASKGNSNAGTIVGKLYDGCQLVDNINTATYDFGHDNIVYGHRGSHCDIARNVSTFTAASYAASGKDDPDGASMLACDPACKNEYYRHDHTLYVAPAGMADEKYYNHIGIRFADNRWGVAAGTQFAVPYISQMTE